MLCVYLLTIPFADAFLSSRTTSFIRHQTLYKHHKASSTTLTMIRAPPGSGYALPEDEKSFFPESYEPMMEYPGTMRPGRTPENQPYSSLPIQESDPDPVPWPHFQEIEWHHNWGSPHEHAIPMEEFIEMNGRWATAEMEAQMRAGARRGVRERREMEESSKAASFIVDDDGDDDDVEEETISLGLGDGVGTFLGSDTKKVDSKAKSVVKEDDEDDDDENEDDFLLDLGLDITEDADEDEDDEPAFAARGDDKNKGILEAMQSMIDDVDEDDDSDLDDIVGLDFDDLGLDFDDDDDSANIDDDDDSFVMVDDEENDDIDLDVLVGQEDIGDDDNFDDGGFDYD